MYFLSKHVGSGKIWRQHVRNIHISSRNFVYFFAHFMYKLQFIFIHNDVIKDLVKKSNKKVVL